MKFWDEVETHIPRAKVEDVLRKPWSVELDGPTIIKELDNNCPQLESGKMPCGGLVQQQMKLADDNDDDNKLSKMFLLMQFQRVTFRFKGD